MEEEEGFEKVQAKVGAAPDFGGMKRTIGECSRVENYFLNTAVVSVAPPPSQLLLARRSRQGLPLLHWSVAPVSWAAQREEQGQMASLWQKQPLS